LSDGGTPLIGGIDPVCGPERGPPNESENGAAWAGPGGGAAYPFGCP
jgi:hypothetical protein